MSEKGGAGEVEPTATAEGDGSISPDEQGIGGPGETPEPRDVESGAASGVETDAFDRDRDFGTHAGGLDTRESERSGFGAAEKSEEALGESSPAAERGSTDTVVEASAGSGSLGHHEQETGPGQETDALETPDSVNDVAEASGQIADGEASDSDAAGVAESGPAGLGENDQPAELGEHRAETAADDLPSPSADEQQVSGDAQGSAEVQGLSEPETSDEVLASGAPQDETSDEAQGSGEAEPEAVAVAQTRPDLSTDERLDAALEALLLVVDVPAGEELLANALEQPVERIRTAMWRLSNSYAGAERGIDLRRVGDGWRFYTRETYAPYVERYLLDGQRAKLTRAALETLAVIAYRQPVTRSRVAAVRGVNVDGVIRTLLARGLIEEAGTDPDTGGTLYCTTELFLERLGLSSLKDLPPLAPLLPEVDAIDDV